MHHDHSFDLDAILLGPTLRDTTHIEYLQSSPSLATSAGTKAMANNRECSPDIDGLPPSHIQAMGTTIRYVLCLLLLAYVSLIQDRRRRAHLDPRSNDHRPQLLDSRTGSARKAERDIP